MGVTYPVLANPQKSPTKTQFLYRLRARAHTSRWPVRQGTVTLFSMSLATVLESASLARTIPGVTVGRSHVAPGRVLPLRFGQLDEVLPDAGLPRGAVVEIAAPYGLALATSIGLAACASAQSEAKLRGGKDTAGAWCAWIEASATS